MSADQVIRNEYLKALQECDRLRAINADLLEALKEIAQQELSADMSVDDQLGGDFEGAYNHMIGVARAAIRKAEGK